MKHQQWVGHDRPPLAKVAALPTEKTRNGTSENKRNGRSKKKGTVQEQKRKSENKSYGTSENIAHQFTCTGGSTVVGHSYLSPPRDDDSADNVDRRLLGDRPLGEWLLLLVVVLLVLLVFLFLFLVFLAAAVVVVSLWRLINPHTAKDWCEGSEMERNGGRGGR